MNVDISSTSRREKRGKASAAHFPERNGSRLFGRGNGVGVDFFGEGLVEEGVEEEDGGVFG